MDFSAAINKLLFKRYVKGYNFSVSQGIAMT